jgi:glycosyltransferase involved in cell wall biosynthesis
MGALANRMYPLARHLAARGHEVFVATGMPNYPRGVVFPGYRGKWTMREQADGVTVLRTLSYVVPRNESKWAQLLSYLSFVPAVWAGGLRAGPVDIVFVTSPPIFPAIAAVLIARIWRAKLVFDVRDLWPDEMIACGAAREGTLAVAAIRGLERWIYGAADCVCCTTQAFIETVVERGVPRERTLLATNGADLDLFKPMPRDNPIAPECGLGNRFVVMYSGALGIKHGLRTVLEAAALLRKCEDILFLFVGAGADEALLTACTRDMALDNVTFAGERPVAELPAIIARADVCLSSLLPEPYLEKIISVKLFEYMACARPVVAAQAGEGARIVQESGGGIVVRPGDAHAMASAIMALYRDRPMRDQLGRNGREFVERHYSRAGVALRLDEAFRSLSRRAG